MQKAWRIFLVIFLFQGPLIYTQNNYFGSPTITNFSRADYHAGTQNWSIIQDDRGIMYFGNNKGLLEFDGTNWQIYPLPNRTIVRSAALAESGELYVGGQDEFGVLETNIQGQTSYKSLTHLLPEAIKSFEDIWQIFIKDKSVYFCSERAVFMLRDSSITVISPESGEFENYFKVEDHLYVQDKTLGLFEVFGAQLQAVPGASNFPNQRVVSMLPYKEEILVVTVSKGLYLLNSSGLNPLNTASSSFLIQNQPYCAISLSNGNYAIGTAQNGILIIDQAGNPVRHLNKSRGLQNNTVLSLCEDRQQNLWLGLDNGIDYAEINSPFSLIQSESGIEGTGYASIIHDGLLYLGTNQGVYATSWASRSDPMSTKKFNPVPNAIGQVWSFNKINGDIILGQHKGTSYLENGRARTFSTLEGAWKFVNLKAHPGYAIQGTYSGLVLFRDENYNGQTDTPPNWVFVRNLEGFSESSRVFEQDESGHIWVSHAYKGLFKIKLSETLESIQEIKFYNTEQGLPEGLFINVSKIRNELIFTTPHGVYRYLEAEDRFIPHEEFNEIFGSDATVHRLLEDELGNIWFSVNSDFGLLKVQEKGVFNKLELIYFNQIQADLVDGFEHVYAYDESNVFIGTEKGFIHYNPLKSTDSDFSFETLIRKVVSITKGDSVVFGGNRLNQFSTEKIEFLHYQNDFRFTYSVPYYEKIDQVSYRYRLNGFDNDWSEWTSKTEKEYTNLKPGAYQFIIQARNAYGHLSAENAFAFKIATPWYSTVYARIVYFILTLTSLIGIVKFVSKREEKKTEALKLEQARKLEIKEAEHKKEVEKSEDEIVQLRNEKLQIDINLKNSQLASATMHLVQKSEILMKIKSDLTDLKSEVPKESKRKIEQISRTIEADIRLDDNWEQFEIYFDQVHENFFKRLRQNFPDLTPKDQKLCAYLRMNLTTKEIAPLLNISVRGVEISRYRLRKKLELDSETNLVAYIMDI